MKRLSLLFVLVCFGCKSPDTNAKVPVGADFQTVATGRVYEKVSQLVKKFHNLRHAECKFSRIKSIKPFAQQARNQIEAWTVEGCSGRLFTYRVVIAPGIDTYVSVDNFSDTERPPQ